jgi:F-type H+-transporting ATPase subunit alpha
MHVADQVMSIYAGTKGYLDKVPQKQVAAWEEQFLRFVREQRPQVRELLIKQRSLKTREEEKAKVPKGKLEQDLDAAIQAFQGQFRAPA